ncbi:Glutathione S-transferase 1-1 [Armadillidium nasatum]|uniref:Glutathione S-transferase 1-1 n=1 Tax=Armadillidium nasatum TaxID=96803 RepID=A0A5N5TIK2_9CRUS|nr:Glutathione S-transferase 1-1 [Armadillidium nasatum]
MDFYYSEISPACRSVMLTAKAVGAKLNKKPINLEKKEHLKPEYIKINPQHTIPTLVDGNLKLRESRPICTYLASQHGKDESLYPKDPKERALVDNLLSFDMGTLSQRMKEYIAPVMFHNEKPDPEKKKNLEEALTWLNDLLEGHEFSAGNKITVADFVLISTVSSIIEAGIVDISKYKNIKAWVEKCKSKMNGYDTENGKGAKAFGEVAKSKLPNSESKKDSKDEKEPKDAKDAKDAKDDKNAKDTKDEKEGKDMKDAKEMKDPKETKDPKIEKREKTPNPKKATP